MTSYNLKTPDKIPPDIDETYDLTPSSITSLSPSPMQISARKAKMIAKKDEQFNLYDTSPKILEKTQKSVNLLQQRANTNLAAIVNLVKIQISLEEDWEILTILKNQKTNLLEILKKKSGKESNFKITENKVFAELQNKFSNLEKAIDQKLNRILTSIENNQSTTNSWTKIVSLNSSQQQEQQQEFAISNQIKVPIKPAKQEQKQSNTQAKKEAAAEYSKRRLILQINQQIWTKYDGYRLRNQINDAFLQQEKTEKPIAASVVKSLTGQSIVVIVMPGYTVDFLIKKRQIWKQIFIPYLKSMGKSTDWSKLVIHVIPIVSFSMNDELYLLKEEIETFNPEIKLLKNPR